MTRTARWTQRLSDVRSAGRWRAPRPLTPTGPVTGTLDGREVIVACSNDYLGLAWEVGGPAAGGGSGSSRLISGSRPIHHQLEDAVGAWFDGEAVLFPSGWQANVGVLSTLPESADVVASDALNHASIIDGLRLSKAQRHVIPHCRPDAVPSTATLIVLEGLYSMDGDVPPFAAYPPAPLLIVDEAHAVGCLGPRGRGAAAAAGVRPDVVIGTFGKAFGAAGAFAVGSPPLRDLLQNLARSYIFTTAAPEPVVAMALTGFRRATEDPTLQQRLATVAHRLRTGLRQLGWTVVGDHHVLGVVLGNNALACAARLLERGVWAAPIRWPTVPQGSERIRLGASAAMTNEQVDRVLDAFGVCAATDPPPLTPTSRAGP